MVAISVRLDMGGVAPVWALLSAIQALGRDAESPQY
jgi:hypothetical protein